METLNSTEENGDYKYKYLLFKNAFKIWKDSCCYYVSLYYGRFWLSESYVSDLFTFTDLKNQILGKEHFEKNKDNLVLTKYVYEALESLLSLDDDTDELFFEVPIKIQAQSLSDRPSFGDTRTYAIYGVKFSLFFSM